MKKYISVKNVLYAVILLVIVLILIAIGIFTYIAVAKPFGIDVFKIPSAVLNYGTGESTYNHPLLTKDQEVLLESVGVDTKSLPTQITNAQLDCATQQLGAERVNELKAGASPNLTDYLKAKDCFSL